MIISASEEHIKDIRKILDLTLGEDYVSSVEDILAVKGMMAFVSRANDQTTGFIFGKKIETSDELIKFYPTLKHQWPFLSEGPWGIIDPVGVHPSFQKRGIGGALIERIKQELNSAGVKEFISPAWGYQRDDNTGLQINIGKALEAAGFYQHSMVPNFWKDECDLLQSFCPMRTGNCECKCRVIFYIKNDL
jgi:GNAT superfamily N-acetyltransferase